MFTGLVEQIGSVRYVAGLERGSGLRIAIDLATRGDPMPTGSSLAVDGACLTIIRSLPNRVEVEVGPETLEKTTIGDFRSGRRVHLERPLEVGGRLDGHIVTGHVDGVGVIEQSFQRGDVWELACLVPLFLTKYVVKKGSICIDGVSLTINTISRKHFSVALVPHTRMNTHLYRKPIGTRVNLEVDIMAKHLEELAGRRLVRRPSKLELAKLKEFGFAK